jgi:recombinational DNA repair protein (RecF pathway)
MYVKINGLILIKKNIKEKSALIYILTQELGIIKARIDGINRSESKLISVIQPGVWGRFFLVSELNFFKILSFLPFKIPIKVFKKFPYSYLWALRFLRYFSLFSVSSTFFNQIINLDYYLLKHKKTFLIWFLNSIFEELGITPNLTHCSKCNRQLSGDVYYRGAKFYCYRCRKPSYEKIDAQFYKNLVFYYKNNKLLYIKDKKLIDFLKRIFKSHLKEINL